MTFSGIVTSEVVPMTDLTPRSNRSLAPQQTVVVPAGSVGTWQHAVSVVGAPCHVRSDRPDGLSGQLRSRCVAGVHISQLSATEQFVDRTLKLVEASGSRDYILHLQSVGFGTLIQDDRETLLAPGDLSVYDLGRPVALSFKNHFTCVSIRFPRDMIQVPQQLVAQITATRMSGNEGVTGIAISFFSELARSMDKLHGQTGTRLANHAVELAETVFHDRLDLARGPQCPGRRATLVRRILDYIDSNLADPTLTPAIIADANFISTRNLHGLFRDIGVTVSQFVRQQRLAQCKRNLTDPAMLDRSISTIAEMAGFFSASYFSQAFRKEYGESASEVRRSTSLAAVRQHIDSVPRQFDQ
jgi:AraC-like DNA-binding protein